MWSHKVLLCFTGQYQYFPWRTCCYILRNLDIHSRGQNLAGSNEFVSSQLRVCECEGTCSTISILVIEYLPWASFVNDASLVVWKRKTQHCRTLNISISHHFSLTLKRLVFEELNPFYTHFWFWNWMAILGPLVSWRICCFHRAKEPQIPSCFVKSDFPKWFSLEHT